jgi:dolichol-phosphate mannosyltransferase
MESNQSIQAEEIRRKFPPDWEVPEFRIEYWDGKTSDYCVVIPVINEGDRIRQFVQRLKDSNIDAIADIIIVDGGSTDGSLIVDELRSHGIGGVVAKTGSGKLSSQLRVAYAFALVLDYKYIVTIDGNNKDDPSEIFSVFKKLADGFDFVQASRFIQGGKAVNTPLIRYLAIRLIHAPISSLAARYRWTDTTQGFRGYNSSMLLSPRIKPFRALFKTYELLAYLSIIAPRAGYKCAEIPSTRIYPADEVPTKITAIRGSLELMAILISASLGLYDPKKN